MISTAEEFYRLRVSDIQEEYSRAAHDSASEATWLSVIEQYPEMKEWVVHNKTVPISILELLSDDDDIKVRWMVASKRKLTPELFQKLAHDSDESVRNAVFCNAKVPKSILIELTNDSSHFVRENALERLEELK